MKNPLRVVVTGAAGQIGYSLVFRIANGDLLGKDQPVVLSLLEITPALGALQGVVMELEDCAFPLLAGVDTSDDADAAFDGVNYALLVGARPRAKGMERKDLLEANGAIFTVQGKALAKGAADDVRVLVVGNPANTNCLITMNNAGKIPRERFTAMTRLDHNRAIAQVAQKCDVPVTAVTHMTIWGNHSATQYPDLFHAQSTARSPPTSSARSGSKRRSSRPCNSAARRSSRRVARRRRRRQRTPRSITRTTGPSARRQATGSSMAVCSDGSYGVPEGLISGFPCTTKNGAWSIVQGLEIDEFSRRGSTRRSPSSARSGTRSPSSV